MATQQEVDNIIDQLIIDNTTRQIDPAKMRSVLKAINARVPVSSDPSSLTVDAPLSLDPFTGVLSMPKASDNQQGYIDTEDFKKFNKRTSGIPPAEFWLFAKGLSGGNTNDAPFPEIELNDVCICFLPTSDTEGAGEFGFFQYVDAEKSSQDPTAYMPVITALINVT